MQIGEVFIDGYEAVCMKIDDTVCDNTVVLEDGNVICTDSNAIVIPVKATLTIEGDK